jgi:hypothetical protein
MEEAANGGHSTSARCRSRLTSMATPPLLTPGFQVRPPQTSAAMTCF